jgi:hypothetical protein
LRLATWPQFSRKGGAEEDRRWNFFFFEKAAVGIEKRWGDKPVS